MPSFFLPKLLFAVFLLILTFPCRLDRPNNDFPSFFSLESSDCLILDIAGKLLLLTYLSKNEFVSHQWLYFTLKLVSSMSLMREDHAVVYLKINLSENLIFFLKIVYENCNIKLREKTWCATTSNFIQEFFNVNFLCASLIFLQN